MNLKKAFLLLLALLLAMFSFLNGASPLSSRDQVESETGAEKLIDRASYCYGILEDYPLALKYLRRALEVADNSTLKANALVKTAYVFFLMGERASLYKKYILKSLELAPGMVLERLYYKLRFIRIFNALKKDPLMENEALRVVLRKPLPGERDPGALIFLKVQSDYLLANDGDYRDVYSSGFLVPTVKAGVRLARNVYIWSGFGAVSAAGTIPEVGEDASSSQRFLFFGINYNRPLSKSLGYKVEFGAVRISYREETLGVKIEDTTIGFDAEAGVVFSLGKMFFSEFSAGYLYATDVINDRKVLFGGFKAGLGVGVRF